jgi:hypothetical protein
MSSDTLQQLVDKFNSQLTLTLREREQLIDEVNSLRALLATKNELMLGLEAKLSLLQKVHEKRECNHLWRPAYVTVPSSVSNANKPVWKCECCGEEMPR